MVRSLRDSKAHLSELVDRASRGEDVLITVRGKVQARLTKAAPSKGLDGVVAWRRRLSRLNRKFKTRRPATPVESILEELREERL